jgi:ABC-type transport system substrate-binding protein
MRYAELLQQAFARVGAADTIEPGDQKALTDRVMGHTFDAVIMNWTTTPSPSGVRQVWGSASFARGSPFNAGGWSNAAFDAHVDSALKAAAPDATRGHFGAAYQAAIDDAPAIWLYEPLLVVGKSRRLVTGPLPVDAWWMSVPSWRVTGPRRAVTAADVARDSSR